MAISVTALGAAVATTSSCVLTLGSSVPAGATIVLFVGSRDNTASYPGSVSDDGGVGNTYSVVQSNKMNNTQNQGSVYSFYCYNCGALSAGAKITFAAGVGSSRIAMTAAYVTGLGAGDTLDPTASNVAAGSGTAISVTSGVPTNQNCMFLAGHYFSGNKSANDASWTILSEQTDATNYWIDAGYLQGSGFSTQTWAPTGTPARVWGAHILALKSGNTVHELGLDVTCTATVALSKSVTKLLSDTCNTTVSSLKSLTRSLSVACSATPVALKSIVTTLTSVTCSPTVSGTKNVDLPRSATDITTSVADPVKAVGKLGAPTATTTVSQSKHADTSLSVTASPTVTSLKNIVTTLSTVDSDTTVSTTKSIAFHLLTDTVATVVEGLTLFVGWVNPRRKVSISTFFRKK